MVAANPWPTTGISFRRTRSLPRAISTHDLHRLIQHLCKEAGIASQGHPPRVILKAYEGTTLVAVTMMLTTGVRVGELVGLKVDDIDVDGGSVRVMGKGRRERVVYLTDQWHRSLMQSYLRTREELGPTHPLCLVNTNGDQLTTAAVRARLAKSSTRAGLDRRVTPHMLRHTAATQLIESGVDIRFVQRLLGHASLSTTEIYTHVSDEALRRAVTGAEVLTRSLGAGQGNTSHDSRDRAPASSSQ